MANKVANNAYALLASSLTAGATTIAVQTGQGARFPTVVGGTDSMWLTLVNAANAIEVVLVTAHAAASDNFTVTRGQDGTTALAWNAADRLELRPTAALFNAKADDSLAAHLAGSETFTGAKTFSGGIAVSSGGFSIAGGLTVSSGATSVQALTCATGMTITTGGLTVSAGATNVQALTCATGLTVSAGGASITGNSTVTGTFSATSTGLFGTLNSLNISIGNPTAYSIWANTGTNALNLQGGTGGCRWVNATNTVQTALLDNSGNLSVAGSVTTTTPATNSNTTVAATTAFVNAATFGPQAANVGQAAPTLGTPYTPNANKPTLVHVAAILNNGNAYLAASIGGVAFYSGQTPANANQISSMTFMVPAGASYTLTISAGIVTSWLSHVWFN